MSGGPDDGAWRLDVRVALLEALLQEHGSLRGEELLRLAGIHTSRDAAGEALMAAIDQGRIRQVQLGRYALR